MKDQSKKLQDLKENSSAVFQELFGSGKKALAAAEAEKGIGQAEKIGENQYKIGENIVITNLRGVSEHEFLNYDFTRSPLAWVLNCSFEGDIKLRLSGGEHEFTAFQGKWYDGTFKGKYFGVSSEFYGGGFGAPDSNPAFMPDYKAWKTSPHYFYDGIIEKSDGGILGKKNLAIGDIRGGFNVLSIKPGNMITITLNDGTQHMVTCLSRLGSTRRFAYNVKNGIENKEYKIDHDWSELKGDSEDDFNVKTRIHLSPNQKSINIFKLDVSAGIASAVVTVAGTSGSISEPKTGQAQDFAGGQESFNLAEVPLLNLKTVPKGPTGVNMPLPDAIKGKDNFYILDAEGQKKFDEVVSNIRKGIFQADMSRVRSGLRNGLINGWDGTTQYLKNVMGVQGDNSMAPKEVMSSMNRLNDFMHYMVDRLYVQGDNTKEDVAKQQFVVDRLKQSLGVDEFLAAPEAAPEEIPKKKDSKNIKLETIPSPNNEGIREAIRNILSDNL